MEVHVIRRRDGHGVDLVRHLVEHHTVVFIAPGVGIFVEHLGGVLVINIHKRYDILGFAECEIGFAFASTTDACNVQTFICSKHVSDGDEWKGDSACSQS